MVRKLAFDSLNESRKLSDKDRDLLLNYLNKSPEPNENLKAAHYRISSMYKLNNNGQTFYNASPNLIKK